MGTGSYLGSKYCSLPFGAAGRNYAFSEKKTKEKQTNLSMGIIETCGYRKLLSNTGRTI
jgi:hypothetical protein